MTVMTSEDAQPVSFEDAFRQLAEIAEGMDKGGLTLADATARFERGMKLVQHCNHLLDTAELEITQLRESYQKNDASDGFAIESAPSFDYPLEDDESYEEEDSLPF
jgi:exodeoxyribonuclease VII small subunit